MIRLSGSRSVSAAAASILWLACCRGEAHHGDGRGNMPVESFEPSSNARSQPRVCAEKNEMLDPCHPA